MGVALPAGTGWIWGYAFDVFSIWSLRLPWTAGHFQILALHTLLISAIVIGWLWAVGPGRPAHCSPAWAWVCA